MELHRDLRFTGSGNGLYFANTGNICDSFLDPLGEQQLYFMGVGVRQSRNNGENRELSSRPQMHGHMQERYHSKRRHTDACDECSNRSPNHGSDQAHGIT